MCGCNEVSRQGGARLRGRPAQAERLRGRNQKQRATEGKPKAAQTLKAEPLNAQSSAIRPPVPRGTMRLCPRRNY
eukprot:7679757-Pyramimonas_sp.AAC.1